MDEVEGRRTGPGWLDDIDFDPVGSRLRMGTRSLGERAWLVVDDKRPDELRLKAALHRRKHHDVFAALPGTEEAGRRAHDLVEAALGASGVEDEPETGHSDPLRHPLEAAGRRVQEDLCLLRRESSGWSLQAASLCFPTRWRLREKMGRGLVGVHDTVEGYEEALAERVERLLDGLGDRVVLRRNWFLYDDPALFQPDRLHGPDLVVAPDRCLRELFLRSERQTLRHVADRHVLFTIRVQQEPLQVVVATTKRRQALKRYVAEAPGAAWLHRGLSERQREPLHACLTALDQC